MLELDLDDRESQWALYRFRQQLISCGLFSELQYGRARREANDPAEAGVLPTGPSREAPPRGAL